ncbi:MAG: L-2-amino-thiazoline-4-carboxylic acid hydrolase [bacterium]|nr:L-2-amino-thiazoline-4-carboxylic acid hydrolase [bacterium]
MSDAGGQGLRRTGTLALGSNECDFRYKSGGEPLRLAAQYPDQIRLDRE